MVSQVLYKGKVNAISLQFLEDVNVIKNFTTPERQMTRFAFLVVLVSMSLISKESSALKSYGFECYLNEGFVFTALAQETVKTIKFCGEEHNLSTDIISCKDATVTDITPLKELKKLKGLYLSGTSVKDLRPLNGLKDLEKLDLYETKVSDLSPLKGLVKLELLVLDYTQIEDISPLKMLKNLKELYIQDTKVKNLTSLKELKNLKKLHLRRTEVSDLTPLMGLKDLKKVYITGTQVTESKADELRSALPNCKVLGP